jgi:general secretion pathway protein K
MGQFRFLRRKRPNRAKTMPSRRRELSSVSPPSGESGFALVGAVASILLFALLAAAILAWTQRNILAGTSEINAARAADAADAGFVIALNGLLSTNPAQRWTIDGRRREASFNGARLDISIVDERGKVPINLLDEETATALFETSGLSGDSLRIARDSILDWIDDDDEPREDGAERGYYRSQGIVPRNGPLQTIEELGRVRGIDATLVERLRPLVTTDFGSGSFDARFAQPLAIAIMSGTTSPTPESIARAREASGQVTALGFIEEGQMIGRPLTVVVKAIASPDAQSLRQCIVELTGNRIRPYVIRNCH